METSEAVVTAGVTSHVYDDDGEQVGHVLLLDLDDVGLLEAVGVADHLDSVAVVLESSEGSHHVWSLGVDTLNNHTLTGLSYDATDDGHVGASFRRGYAVLRFVGKVTSDDEMYKDRPTVTHVSAAGARGHHSKPHAEMLRSLVADQGDDVSGAVDALNDDGAPCGVTYIGDAERLRIDKYQTLTDDGKEALRGGA